MREQTARPGWLVVVDDRGLGVGIDVALEQVKVPMLDGGVGFLELRFAVAERFHFAALECDAAFELGLDVVIVKRLAVLDSRGEVGFLVSGHRSC